MPKRTIEEHRDCRHRRNIAILHQNIVGKRELVDLKGLIFKDRFKGLSWPYRSVVQIESILDTRYIFKKRQVIANHLNGIRRRIRHLASPYID
jgi:hypothetical protein